MGFAWFRHFSILVVFFANSLCFGVLEGVAARQNWGIMNGCFHLSIVTVAFRAIPTKMSEPEIAV